MFYLLLIISNCCINPTSIYKISIIINYISSRNLNRYLREYTRRYYKIFIRLKNLITSQTLQKIIFRRKSICTKKEHLPQSAIFHNSSKVLRCRMNATCIKNYQTIINISKNINRFPGCSI